MPWSRKHHSRTIHGMTRVSAKQDKDQDLVRLGGAIRARRMALPLSQEALADLAEIGKSGMNHRLARLVRIAKEIHHE